jgi:uncharacterized protein (UPF0276 family)
MVPTAVASPCRTRPMLSVTYSGDDSDLLRRLVPLTDMIEISPDAMARSDGGWARLRPELADEIAEAGGDVELVAHGVGLSIGSFDHWQESYLQLMDDVFQRLRPAWHSEHLGYTVVAGEDLGTMLPVPRTDEALDLVCERAAAVQRRYGVPFLLENVVSMLPEPEDATYSPASFLNEVTSRSGCGVLLDIYNLECDQHNQGLDVDGFLAELDMSAVVELHIAGGTYHGDFRLDVHSRTCDDGTLGLAMEVVDRSPNLRAVTFEYMKAAVPTLGHEAICEELARVRTALER